ncbi:hypothetical protein [Pseudalkalibacillus decolorationis]|uniref:hypothetical protein n=1 Tax=Pseudalkalibacillus decolorationis TaxID=163879 RepID=UPI002148AA27|nr:hypothetical protein [Pseudalkalibacillus decolorationis]
MNGIQEVLNDYFKAWNKGFVSKNGDGIRAHMSEKFVGYWAHSSIEKPDPYYYDYDLSNVLSRWIMRKKRLNLFRLRNEKTEWNA